MQERASDGASHADRVYQSERAFAAPFNGQLRGFPGAMADYTFNTGRNGVHRFQAVRIRDGKPILEAVLDERP